MLKRTKFFESLEERRLLTGWAASTADAPAAISEAAMSQARTADFALIGPSAAAASSGNQATPTTPSGGDAAGADSANEYAGADTMTGAPLSSQAADGASLAALNNLYFAPEASGTAPYYSGSSYAPTKTYTTASTDPVPTGPATLAAMAPPTPPLQTKSVAAELQPLASASPAAANLANVTRSGLGGLEARPDEIMAPTDMAGSPIDLPPPGTTAPVAMLPAALNSALGWIGRSASTALNGEPAISSSAGALDASFAQSRWLAGLMSGAASADVPGIEQAVDRLCERMERWGEEMFREAGEWRLSEAVVLAAGAAAAFEYVRAQFRESGSGPFAENTREPWQPRLRKPFGRPADSRRRFFRRHRDQA